MMPACDLPPIAVAVALGAELQDGACLYGDLDLSGRGFVQVPDLGIARGFALQRSRAELGLRASEIGPLEAEGVVWHETGQIFSILVRRGKGSGQDMRLPLDRPVSRMLGMWLAALTWAFSRPGRLEDTKNDPVPS